MSEMKRTSPQSPMGERIFQKMEELKLNAKQLSLSAGLNETYVRDLLKAENPNPRFQHLKALASTLGVSVEWLDSEPSEATTAEIVNIWDRIPERTDRDRVIEYARKLANKDQSS